MDLGLKGQRAIITGGTRGIGRAIADCLADEGCDVGFCARQAAQVKETEAALKAKGVNAIGNAVDLAADPALLRRWIDQTALKLGGLDILVCNVSGGAQGGEAGWRTNFEVDLMGTIRTIDAAAPYLANSKSGSVVIISSIAALEDFGGVQPYNSLKAALTNYSANFSQAAAVAGVRCNTISPGVTHCKDGAWDQIKKQSPKSYDETAERVPLGKRMAQPDEIARVAVFVASPAASYMTGANVVVDGGMTKRVQY